MRAITTPLVVLGAYALAGSIAFAAEQPSPYVGPWPGWHTHWSGFWWICPLMMLLMLGIFAVGFFALRRDRGDWRPPWFWMGEQPGSRLSPEGYRGVTPESAMDILKKRYARGEIDKDEYEEMKVTIISADR